MVPLALSWKLPASVTPGTEFTMELRGKSDAAIKGASIQLRYDPDRIEVLAVKEGDRVGVPWLYSACGHCEFCLAAQEPVCA